MLFVTYVDIETMLPLELRSLLSNDDTETDNRINIRHIVEIEEEFVIESLQKIYIKSSIISVRPQILKNITLNLAIYRLYRRKTDEVPDIVVQDKDLAIAWLEQIKKGEILLEGVTPNTNNPKVLMRFDDTHFRGEDWVF